MKKNTFLTEASFKQGIKNKDVNHKYNIDS